jgi:hypothetical protein
VARPFLLSSAIILLAWSASPPALAQTLPQSQPNMEAKAIVVALLRQGCRATAHPRDNQITITSGPQRITPEFYACASAAAVLMREATGERMVLVDQDGHPLGGLAGSPPPAPARPHWRCVSRRPAPPAELVCSLVP